MPASVGQAIGKQIPDALKRIEIRPSIVSMRQLMKHARYLTVTKAGICLSPHASARLDPREHLAAALGAYVAIHSLALEPVHVAEYFGIRMGALSSRLKTVKRRVDFPTLHDALLRRIGALSSEVTL